MQLPKFNTDDKDFQMMQTKWSGILNPVIANPLNSNNLLTNIKLGSGVNTIDHLLQRELRGWIIVGINAAATIFDVQASNQSPQLTLKLNSSAPCTISLVVF